MSKPAGVQVTLPKARNAHRRPRQRRQSHVGGPAQPGRQAEAGIRIAPLRHGKMLHVGGIVGAGAKPDLMISRKMLKDMEGADFVALVGRERDPMRKEEYFCHTPDETKNNPLRLILPSVEDANMEPIYLV